MRSVTTLEITLPVPPSVLLLAQLYTDADPSRRRDVTHAGYEAAARIADVRDESWAERFKNPAVRYRSMSDPVERTTHWMQTAVLRAVGFRAVDCEYAFVDGLSVSEGGCPEYESVLGMLNELVRSIIERRRLATA